MKNVTTDEFNDEDFDDELYGESQLAQDTDAFPLDDVHNNYESSMRLATDISADDRRTRRRTRRRKIRTRRGAFRFLPVKCSNDLVHGSWWFVLGSLMATIIPIVPLVDLFYPFWKSTPRLPLLSDAATFGLLIASGFFFTIGSLVFVRATEEPPLKPLLANVSLHLATDELLAAWMFLVGSIPYPFFMGVYVHFNATEIVYWGCLLASVLFVIATYFFVLTCYPSNQYKEGDDTAESIKNEQYASQISHSLFPDDCWIHKHLSNDWLASTWIFFYATLLMWLGSLFMLFSELFHGGTALEIFDWFAS